MKFPKKKKLALLLAGALMLPGLSACSGPSTGSTNTSSSATNADMTPTQKSGFYFDTVINLTLYGLDGQKQELFDGAFALAQRYDQLLSMQNPTSDLSKINDHPGEWVAVDPDTIEVLKSGVQYSAASGGSFDITIGKISALWNISEAAENDHQGSVPKDSDIKPLLSHVGYEKIQFQGNQVMLTDSQAAIDLGGIGKGFIADKMRDYLKGQGVKSALINLGGNVLVVGQKPDNTPFRIGIQKPFDESGGIIASVKLNDQTCVTSGTYQRYFKGDDGTIYHHMIDPKTGYPKQNDLDSVSIITKNSTDADALSTTAFLKGKEEGLRYIESLEGVEAIFIDHNNNVSYTSGIGKTVPFTLNQ